ncbi:hypothetical protein BAE44_0021078 [Dichanthelium oligosanthes]|uniref:Uncharacterized protein n=1 Tax=Dichanthelium oligosanthes TaxID=888268 RepID=A0A1E5UYP3_9POAL|nr:hypothetical protein BAE44_0021078 [Dichanthelium oligosanthes]
MQDRIRRQGQYGEADFNSMVAAQLHHYQAQQRVQQHPENSYTGRDPGQASGERQYTPPKVRQSQWDRGQGAAGTQSFYDGQRSDPKVGLEKQPSKETRDRPRTDRTETRYEDYNLPRTFEGLEQSFHEDIMMLSKELQDAENAENSRHRERLKEINTQYQEKLLALRARQANYRDEFLRKESLTRQQQYQQASMSHYANNSSSGEQHGYHPTALPGEQHGYHPTAAATPAASAGAGGAYGEAQRGYSSAQYESFSDRPDYPEFHGGGRGRGRGFEHRGQYPSGRAYNSGGRRF